METERASPRTSEARTPAPSSFVLVVDDDAALREAVTKALRVRGFRTASADNGATAIRKALRDRPDLILLDARLPDMSGLEVLRRVRRGAPEVAAVFWTGYGSVSGAVEAVRHGALEYIEKPVRPSELVGTLDRVLESSRRASAEATGILGESGPIRRARGLLRQVAEGEAPVLVLGESGTGKELAARAVHDLSDRTGPFVALNCAAVTESLLESELFGYEDGAFTGATQGGREGLIGAAAGGTLFLDEIGEMALGIQAKLLRVLQERSYRPVGSTETRPVDCRIVASTNRDLGRTVSEGGFRSDLFYRLNAHTVVLPPLRERGHDVMLLAKHFLESATAAMGKSLCGFAPEACRALEQYGWPGNVRELKNVVEHAAVLCRTGAIQPGHVEFASFGEAAAAAARLTLRSLRIRDVESDLIRAALAEADGNVSGAARLLGINRSTLYNKLREHRIDVVR